MPYYPAPAITGITSVNSDSGPAVVLDQDEILDGTFAKQFTATEKTKLSGVATGATANSSDATLLARGNHTGTQAQSTVANLTTDLAAKAPLESPTLTGTPVAPTVLTTDSSNTVATTNFVHNAIEDIVWYGSQAEYDALSNYTDFKFYAVKD